MTETIRPDRAILAAVAAAPTDPLPKLIYADWLDNERGDAKGAKQWRRYAECPPLTLEEAKTLAPGTVLYHLDPERRNKSGEHQRWRVNGKVKLWKRNPGRIYVPLKHGLYAHDSLSASNFRDGVCSFLTTECPDV